MLIILDFLLNMKSIIIKFIKKYVKIMCKGNGNKNIRLNYINE